MTIVYNFLGFTCFTKYFTTYISLGLLSPEWNEPALIQVFQHGVKSPIWSHPTIEELTPYSRLIRFICRCHAMFLSEFAKNRNDFPGVDGEAFFVGTVLHSLDHTCAEHNLEDPLWLDVNCPKFGKMAEIGRIVRVGFVQDLHGLIFHRKFKDTRLTFYQNVYEKASRIDVEYANEMDTCIIK